MNKSEVNLSVDATCAYDGMSGGPTHFAWACLHAMSAALGSAFLEMDLSYY